jgi:hypothetical protein
VTVDTTSPAVADQLSAGTRLFYRCVLRLLDDAGLPFLVGGAYAFERYTGIARHTKDLDIFVHPRDFERTLAVLREAGYATDVPFPHWLGKARAGDEVVDVIFSSGNGVATVDDRWLAHGVADDVLGVPTRLCPPEEMIWSKAFIMERERYDGADVAHLVRACAETLDWPRLLERFGRDHWRVLLSHLLLFGFVYPCERDRVPPLVVRELLGRLVAELNDESPREPICQGTLLSRAQYLVDVEGWGYADARLAPRGNMTGPETAAWTAGIVEDGPPEVTGAPGARGRRPEPSREAA